MTDKLSQVKLFLLDMDGTLYLGDRVLDGAREFIATLERLGLDYMYLTNNSSRACSDYIKRLNDLGFPCGKDDVFSSSIASAMYILENYPGKRVYAAGTRALLRELAECGVTLTDTDPDVVLVGFDTELTYEKLYKACSFIRKGAAFIACNPDLVCPVDAGEVLPDCGSICRLIEASSGVQPRYIGKPETIMIDIILKKKGLKANELACVGDRLYTDIAVAQNAGAVSICVLSGETDEKTAFGYEPRPDYIFPSVKELGEGLEGLVL